MFRNTRYGGWNFHLFLFQFVSKQLFRLFQFVSVVLLYNLYVSMFRNTRYGAWNFHLFLFQFVSKRFETIESVDLEIFCLFHFVSVVLLYNLYVSMFRNTRYGTWNFHLFRFQFVSKRFETIESVDLEIFCLFQFVSVVLLYNLYVFETPDMGPGIFTFFCFSLFRNVSKQLKKWGNFWNFHLSICFRNTRYGAWNFHLFLFQFVSKQLKRT